MCECGEGKVYKMQRAKEIGGRKELANALIKAEAWEKWSSAVQSGGNSVCEGEQNDCGINPWDERGKRAAVRVTLMDM